MCEKDAEWQKRTLLDIATRAVAENRRLTEEVKRLVEMIRIKDDLINRQVQRIMHLESLRG